MTVISHYYIALFVFLLISCATNKVLYKNLSISFFVALLILFSGLRYNAGVDYFSYQNMILGSYSLDYIEPFSRYLLLFARYYEAPWLFFGISSLIYIGNIIYGLNRMKVYGSLSIYIFTTFTLMYLSSFGFVRQYAAIGFFFMGCIFLYEKKPIHFIVAIILASLFHFTALIYIVLYPLRNLLMRKYSLFIHLLFVLMAFFSINIFLKIISKIPQVSYYVTYMIDDKFGVYGLKIFVSLLFVFMFVVLFQYLLRDIKSTNLIFAQNMVSLGLIVYSIFLTYGEHFSRLSYYFFPFLIVWIVLVHNKLQKNSNKLVFSFSVVAIGIFYYFSTLYFAQGAISGDFLNNYQFFWLEAL